MNINGTCVIKAALGLKVKMPRSQGAIVDLYSNPSGLDENVAIIPKAITIASSTIEILSLAVLVMLMRLTIKRRYRSIAIPTEAATPERPPNTVAIR